MFATNHLRGEAFWCAGSVWSVESLQPLFTYELARRLEGTGVSANVIHPGLVRSSLMKEAPAPVRWITRLICGSPEKTAETVVYYGSSRGVEGVTGKFFKGRKTIEPSPYARDVEVQRRLWEISSELAKLPQKW